MKIRLLLLLLLAVRLGAQTTVFQSSYVPDTETPGAYNRTSNVTNGVRTAVQFSTGGTAYTFSSVNVRVRASDPVAALSSVFLLLYSDASDTPGSALQTLTNPGALADYPVDPAADASYLSSGSLTLAANTKYWLVYEPTDTGLDTSVLWNVDQTFLPTNGLTAFGSAVGGTTAWSAWSVNPNPLPAFTVYGTAIPEPSTYALLGGLAALGLAFARRRGRSTA